jgi:hypothetical protein
VKWGTQFGGNTLRGATKERWRELCERAIFEQDPERFVAIIEELLQVLEEREEAAADATGLSGCHPAKSLPT